MRTKDIGMVLENFINKSNYKSILIDGEWGCGKTHEVNVFLKNNKTKNVAYASLFGIESLNELNSSIYCQLHKVKRLTKNIVKEMSKLTQIIPEYGKSVSEVIDSLIGTFDDNNRNKSALIIIDDLERMSPKIDYADLLGYIGSLFDNDCRILCLVNSSGIEDKKRKKEFQLFKEKVFNDYYIINTKNIESLFEILGNEFEHNEEVCKLFDGNLRNAQKAKHLFTRVGEIFNNRNATFEEVGLNNTVVMEACLLAVQIGFDEDYNTDTDDKDYLELLDNHYNYHIRKSLKKYKEKYKDAFETIGFEDLVTATCILSTYLDENRFINYYFANESQQTSILDREFYYLSDKDKKTYCSEFCKMCKNNAIEFSAAFVRILGNVVSYNDYSKDDLLIKSIVKIALSSENHSEINELKYHIHDYDLNCSSETGQKFATILNKRIKESETLLKAKALKETFTAKNYLKMIDFIENCRDKKTNMSVISILESNNYYFPPLEKNMIPESWSYCHSVASLVSTDETATHNFINYCKRMCKKHKNSRCVLDRCYALIKYKIDANYKMNDLIVL